MSKETIKAKADGRNGQIDFDIEMISQILSQAINQLRY